MYRAVPTTVIDGEIRVEGIPDFPWICGSNGSKIWVSEPSDSSNTLAHTVWAVTIMKFQFVLVYNVKLF